MAGVIHGKIFFRPAITANDEESEGQVSFLRYAAQDKSGSRPGNRAVIDDCADKRYLGASINQVAWSLLAFSQPNHIVVYAHRLPSLCACRQLELFWVYTRHTSSCAGLLAFRLPNHIVCLCSSTAFSLCLQATRIILGIYPSYFKLLGCCWRSGCRIT